MKLPHSRTCSQLNIILTLTIRSQVSVASSRIYRQQEAVRAPLRIFAQSTLYHLYTR